MAEMPDRISRKPDGWEPWMSDCPREVWTMHREVLDFHGRVLVTGLGLGIIAALLERNDAIEEIVVVERERDVVDLVWPHLGLNRSTVIVEDAYRWTRRSSDRFDFAFLDTWPVVGHEVMDRWIAPAREAADHLVPGQDRIRCWGEDYCRAARDDARRYFALAGSMALFGASYDLAAPAVARACSASDIAEAA